MGALKKLFGMQEMESTEHNHLMLHIKDITELLKIDHENEVLLGKIRKKLLAIYKEIMSDGRLKTPRIQKLIHELEFELGMEEKKLVPETKAKMRDENEVLTLLKIVEGIIEAEKEKYKRAA